MGTIWVVKANIQVPSRPLPLPSPTSLPTPKHPAVTGTGQRFIIFRVKGLTGMGTDYTRPRVLWRLGADPATANTQGNGRKGGNN